MIQRNQHDRIAHYVVRNEVTRQPGRHVFVAVAVKTDRIVGGYVQRWRMAGAQYRHTTSKGSTIRSEALYSTEVALWDDVQSFCRRGSRTVVWAHNAGYMVRISRCLDILTQAGWELESHNISNRGTWMQWRRNGVSLVIVDTISIWPMDLDSVASQFGLSKLDGGGDVEDTQRWEAKVRRDLLILTTATWSYLCWLKECDMGNWQMTAPAQAWAVFRHKFLRHKLLVHDYEDALQAERRAMWTGRCEAWMHGNMYGQIIHEWDISQCYPRVAERTSVPTRIICPMPDGFDWKSLRGNKSTALLAQCTVRTELPVVPTSYEGRILWPIGEFDTTLWDTEIFAALDAGAEVTVHSGWVYRKAPALRDWARWIIETSTSKDDDTPAWLKGIIKRWGPQMIGRLAMRYRRWEEYATAPESTVMRGVMHDTDKGTTHEMMQAGRTLWVDDGLTEWSQSMPSIAGYIQATARVWLWDIISRMPPQALLYCDTDSVLTTDEDHSAMQQIAQALPHMGLRLKTAWRGIQIRGPRHLITGPKIRISGIPSGAVKRLDDTYVGEVWEGTATAMTRGHTDTVHIRDRTWKTNPVDRRRSGPEVGWTTAIRIG